MDYKKDQNNKEGIRVLADQASRKKADGKSTFQFTDNRPQNAKQKSIQKMADNSPGVLRQKRTIMMINSASVSGNTVQQKQYQNSKVIQKMDEDKKEESIGDRLAGRRAYGKMTSRQRKNADRRMKTPYDRPGGSSRRSAIRERLKERVARGLWNEISRPSFTEETWDTMLGATASRERADGVTVYRAVDGEFYPRKRDRVGKEDFITLDHKKNWKEYILSNAAPESDGKISKISAREAYNDTANLQLMSSKANSSKNGPKGMFN